MYATEKPVKRKFFNYTALIALAACLIGVLLLGPVRGTIAYVTSSPVTVVNTFEGVVETEPATPTEPDTSDAGGGSTEPDVSGNVSDSTGTSEDTGTGTGSSAQNADTSKTGDDSHILLYVFTAAAALAAVVVILLLMHARRKRQPNRQNDKEEHEKK